METGIRKTTTEEMEAELHDHTLTPRDDRRIRGKLLRENVSHESHAVWKAPADRPSALQMLEQSNEGRLEDLIPIRYGRMMPSPFTFYRGAAAIMAYDLSHTPNTGVRVQACGDCHLLNFGAFATPERNVVFDINDFDETLPAPWEWDLKRLAVSYVLACRDNGLKAKYAEEATMALARSYRDKMVEYSRLSILDIWYAHLDFKDVIEKTSDEELRKHHRETLKKAEKRTVDNWYFPKLTQQFDGRFLIKDNPPTVFHSKEQSQKAHIEKVKEAFGRYKETLQEDKQRLFDRYQFADMAVKVVGVGSVGTRCSVALFLAPDNEPLLLQVKEARASVLEPYAGKSQYDNHGRRVVAGQRIAQSASDIFLGWAEFEGKHFYVRHLRDMKVKPEPELWDGPRMVEAAALMGNVLARAHARTGDASVIRGYLGTKDTFDKAISQFANAYADQNEKDYEEFLAAIKAGKIKVIIEENRE